MVHEEGAGVRCRLAQGWAPRSWWERDAADGVKWLRSRAASGDCFAVEKLGERLIEGAGLARDVAEGANWLRRAVDAGSSYAMFSLAVRILDGQLSASSPDEGRSLLEDACVKGNLAALTELGTRLIYGFTMPRDVGRGERRLREAASVGDPVAMIRLSRLYDRSVYITAPIGERRRWAAMAGLSSESGLRLKGIYLYGEGLGAPTAPMRRGLISDAASLLTDAHFRGDLIASANLAHLIRRSEIAGAESGPMSPDELLKAGISCDLPWAQVNQALVLALGFGCAPDWTAADELMSGVRSTLGILEWWWSLATDGDPEGDLVLAWLSRHGLAADPEGRSIKERLGRVESQLCLVPAWMREVRGVARRGDPASMQ